MATYNKRAFKEKTNIDKEEYICINNISDREVFVVLQNFTAEGIPLYFNPRIPLTINKKYDVEPYRGEFFVKNDLGKTGLYPKNLFKKATKQNWRDIQLDKLLDNEDTV